MLSAGAWQDGWAVQLHWKVKLWGTTKSFFIENRATSICIQSGSACLWVNMLFRHLTFQFPTGKSLPTRGVKNNSVWLSINMRERVGSAGLICKIASLIERVCECLQTTSQQKKKQQCVISWGSVCCLSISDSELQQKNEAAEDYGRIWRVISHPPLSGLLWFQKVSACLSYPSRRRRQWRQRLMSWGTQTRAENLCTHKPEQQQPHKYPLN